MNSEGKNQSFEKLQHLLKLKRYEQPHPRYFNDFSGQVLSRIHAGKTGGRFETVSDLVSPTPWLHRLWRKLESRPAFAVAIATAACGLVVVGVLLMEGAPQKNLNFMAVGGGNGNLSDLPGPAALDNNFAAVVAAPELVSSTNISPFPTSPNLFQNLRPLETVPASGTSLLPKQ